MVGEGLSESGVRERGVSTRERGRALSKAFPARWAFVPCRGLFLIDEVMMTEVWCMW